MKDRLSKGSYSKLRVSILLSLSLLLWVGLCIGLTLLLFYTGEKEVYPLGSEGEYLNLQILLFHLREVESGGDYAFFIEDSVHYYQIIPLSERLTHAISSFFSLNWSYATCMGNAPLYVCISAALQNSLLPLGLFLAITAIGLLLGTLLKLKAPRWIYPLIASICLLLALLSPLWGSSYHFPIAFLCGASFALSLGLGSSSIRTSRCIGFGFLLIGASWMAYHLIGLYIPFSSSSYSLSSLALYAFQNHDNHTYALATFFWSVLFALPFFIGAFVLTLCPEKKEEPAEQDN